MGCSNFGSSEKYKIVKTFQEVNNNYKSSLIQSTKTYDIYHYKIINIPNTNDNMEEEYYKIARFMFKYENMNFLSNIYLKNMISNKQFIT